MMNLLFIATCAFMSATLAVLVCGILFMAIGGSLNAKYSRKLMMMRIILQAASITTLMLYFVLQ